jgi:hypothetical protein
MLGMEQLKREIERLEGRLDRASDGAAIDELTTIRRGLGSADGGLRLPTLRLAVACKQRWEDMVGDERVRACAGCARPVFNLSEMTRAEAEAVLATRGLTPCVRFYRRPDGTVMTSDCGARPPTRRLAAVAAGATLATATAAMAEPPAVDALTSAGSAAEADDGSEPRKVLTIDHNWVQGIPPMRSSFELGVILAPEKRPAIEWSVWGRLGVGIASQQPDVVARRVTAQETGPSSTWEAAAAVDLTLGVARHGDLRVGAWGEVRTSSDPVAGAELVVEGLSPHPYIHRIGGGGGLVLRAGANTQVVTGALGFGDVGWFRGSGPWGTRHVVGARVVLSVNRAIDQPDWSATLGLEVEPIGAARIVFDLVTGR